MFQVEIKLRPFLRKLVQFYKFKKVFWLEHETGHVWATIAILALV